MKEMRKVCVLLVVAVILVMPASTSAALDRGTPLSAAIPTCATTSVNVSPNGLVTAKGGCKLGRKSVPAKPSFAYTAYDADNYSCGLAKVTRLAARLQLAPAGFAKAHGTVSFVPKAKGRFKSRGKSFSASMTGAPELQCGKAVAPTVNLCDQSQWPPYGWPASEVPNCGSAIPGGPAFLSSPSFSKDGDLSVGHLGCSSGSGRVGLDTVSLTQGPGPYDNGVGGSFYAYRLLCSDGIGAKLVAFFTVANLQGEICSIYGQGSWRVNAPQLSRMSGYLYVAAYMVAWRDWPRHNPNNVDQALGRTSETTKIQLPGTQPPC